MKKEVKFFFNIASGDYDRCLSHVDI